MWELEAEGQFEVVDSLGDPIQVGNEDVIRVALEVLMNGNKP